MRDVTQTHCRKLFTCHGYHHRAAAAVIIVIVAVAATAAVVATVAARSFLCVKSGRVRNWRTLCVCVSLLPSSPQCQTASQFISQPARYSTLAPPDILILLQPFSPYRFAPLVNVCLYIQLNPLLSPPPPSTLTLLHYFFLF